MSIALPQELKTKKRNSLPDDLKKIADELIAEKFDVREEVVEQQAPHPFSEIPAHKHGHLGFYDEGIHPGGGRGYEQDVGFSTLHEPWSRSRIAQARVVSPRLSLIAKALERLDMQNIPYSDRTIRVHPQFLRVLIHEDAHYGLIRRNARRWLEGEKPVIARLFGCDVIEDPRIPDCIIEARF